MNVNMPDDWAEQAKALYEKGENEQAAAIAFRALEHAQQNKDKQQQATAHNTIGITYLKRSQYEKRQESQQDAEQQGEREIADETGRGLARQLDPALHTDGE